MGSIMCKFSFQKIAGFFKQAIAFTLTCIMIMTLCSCGSADSTDVASSSHTATAQNHDLSSDDSVYHSSDCSEDDVNNSSILLLGVMSLRRFSGLTLNSSTSLVTSGTPLSAIL